MSEYLKPGPTAEEQIDSLLNSIKPLETLDKLCADIPKRLAREEIERMWREEKWTGLVFYSLPILKKALKEFAGLGINEQELTIEGLEILHLTIREWSPYLRTGRRPYWFKQYVFVHTKIGLRNFTNAVLDIPEEGEMREGLADETLAKAQETIMPLEESIQDVLGTLIPIERKILEMRFGLGDEDSWPMTQAEVAEKTGLTRVRVGQIEAHTLRNLRHSSRSRRLREYLDD